MISPGTSGRTRRTGAALLVGGIVSGCAPALVSTRDPGPPESAACIVADTEPRDVLSVAVADAVEPAGAPAPRNAAERMVFRQLYETLVRVDCEGRIRPALAESWSADESGRVWQFRLRPGARFVDGSAVTPAAVVASWSAAAAGAARTAAGISGTADLGNGVLRVELRTPIDDARVFALPGLAVARPIAGEAWPLGTRAFRVEPAADRRVIRLVAGDDVASAPRVLEFRAAGTADPRAALDAGTDALVTSDPATLAYARALGYGVVQLPWSRTYVLATRAPPASGETLVPAAALAALATGALGGEARAAEPPFWWREPACRVPSATPSAVEPASVDASAIIYERDDAAGRAIAERLVALAWPPSSAPDWLRALLPAAHAARRTPPTAIGLDRRELRDASSLAAGLALVLALPRTEGNTCTAAATSADAALHQPLIGAPGWRVTPLLDTRDHLVQRAGIGRVVVAGDGTLIFVAREP